MGRRSPSTQAVIGSAGGTRLRPALAGVAGDPGRGASSAGRGRAAAVPPSGHVVNVEPGVDERALLELTQTG